MTTGIGDDLTKYHPPVIMIAGVGRVLRLQEGGGPSHPPTCQKEATMHIHVYKRVEGKAAVLLLPSLARHLPPVLLKGVARGDLAGSVAGVLDSMRSEPL